MGVVAVRLPEDLAQAVEREVAAGRASSTEDYVANALRQFMSAEDELAAAARAGIEDMEAGRFSVVEDLKLWGEANLDRVRKLGEQNPEI